MRKAHNYGVADASCQAAGGEAGIRRLVNEFYRRMGADPRFRTIHAMRPADINISIDKLACFLRGWLGGPRLFQQKYGAIRIPTAHQHLPITAAERDQWLCCMRESIAEPPYRPEFKEYLIAQLKIPAEFIRKRCEQDQSGRERPAAD